MFSYASEALRLALEAQRISRDMGDERSPCLGQHLQVGALIAFMSAASSMSRQRRLAMPVSASRSAALACRLASRANSWVANYVHGGTGNSR
jgi:hypothetical protein